MADDSSPYRAPRKIALALPRGMTAEIFRRFGFDDDADGFLLSFRPLCEPERQERPLVEIDTVVTCAA